MLEDTEAAQHSIYRDRSFLGMLITQFLGAFNDNFFKQFLLYVCLDLAIGNREQNLQGVASVVFAVPFILFSGYCGFLSDRTSKRQIVVISKLAEVVVMFLGMLAFLSHSLLAMFCVLFLMGTQSALFGPSKYGILPELFADRQLPRVNGSILMTTFLSIILAFWVSGEVKQLFAGQLWKASLFCIGIAVLGTLSSLMIRRTPVARPGLPFDWSVVAVSRDTWRVIWQDRRLFWTLLASSVFWTVGGVVYPNATNDLGKIQLGWSDAATGRLAACTGIGITLGCLVAGSLSRSRFDARLVKFGSWGMLLGLIALSLPGDKLTRKLPSGELFETHHLAIGIPAGVTALIWLGFCAGLFTVPLQVFLQAATPVEHKGRIIGAMNLANWIGLAFAGVYYTIWNQLFTSRSFPMPCNAMYGAAALMLIPLALLFRPRTVELDAIHESAATTSQPHALRDDG